MRNNLSDETRGESFGKRMHRRPPAPVRVAVVASSPVMRTLWTAFLDGCPGLTVVSASSTFSKVNARKAVEGDVIFFPYPSKMDIGRVPKPAASCRAVCFGSSREGIPPGVEFISDRVSPKQCFLRLIGRSHGVGAPLNAGEKKSETFTVKELECLMSIRQGRSLKDIAEEGRCSVSTVETRLKRIMKKLDVAHRSDLILHAAARGLVNCPCRCQKVT